MLSITQFEVYVLDNGRWTIHARYGSEERKAAVIDARNTEFTTGLPTKVVAETYFPEIDEAELVTAYISPKARELREAAKSVKRSGRAAMASRHAPAAGTGKGRRADGRARINMRQYIMQGIVAAAVSLVAATLSTAVFSWGLKRAMDAGLALSASLSTNILTYAYALFFLFFFMSLFRSRLPLHRVLSYLWAKPASAPEKTEETTKAIAAAIAPRLRPKQSAAAIEAEAVRAREELKMMRGDPPPEPEVVEAYLPPPVVAAAPEPPPEVWSDKKKDKKKEKKEREAAEKAAREAAERAARAKADREAQEAAAAAAPEPMPLERAVIRRFIAEVVQPATAGTVPDDPVTRRGVALVVTGAVAALAETARTSDAGRVQLIEDALKLFGMSPASIAMFQHQRDELVAVPANASLVAVGRSALTKHLEGADVARILAVALAGWRTPHGQPTGPAPADEAATTQVPAAKPADLNDIYVLTELRMGAAFALTPEGLPDNAAEAERDAAMGLHNSVVRSVIGTHAGHEVKHTGTGIFAQFKAAATAIDAAVEIQRRFTATYGAKLAVAVIANANPDDDPLLTPTVVRQAQTVAARALDGEILAERRVQQAAGLAEKSAPFDDEDEDALVRISAEPENHEPALYQHNPAGDIGTTAAPQVVNAR